MKKTMLALLCLCVLLVTGCGTKGGGQDALEEVAGDVGAQDIPGDHAEVTGCVPGETELVTVLSDAEIQVNHPLYVTCRFEGCEDWDLDGYDFVVAGVQNEDYVTEGHTILFQKPGTYQVACTWHSSAGNEMQDETPAQVTVFSGYPTRVETELIAQENLCDTKWCAGVPVQVDCRAYDELDNEVFGQWNLAIVPQVGVTTAGKAFIPTQVADSEGKAIEYKVACVVDGVHPDDTPATLKLGPNLPRNLYTELSPLELVAGGSAQIKCIPTDLWGNAVKGFPFVVFAPGLDLAGVSLTTSKSGLYEVKCVPQAMDWGLFTLFPATLTVLPDLPSKLDLDVVPEKAVYKVLDKVLLQVAVRDKYNNLVPDAELMPVQIEPAEGVVPLQGLNFKFTEEGQHIFTVKLKENPSISDQILLKVDGSGPLLSVDYPERGATVTGATPVTVTGTVSDQVTGLEAFVINGIHVDVAEDNSFAHDMEPAHSVNIVEAEAQDAGGEKTRTLRSFAFCDKYYPPANASNDGFVSGGLQIFLSTNFIDDGDHNHSQPNDLATLMELVLKNLDFGSLISNPVYDANNYKVFIGKVYLQQPAVQMNVTPGGLTINSVFKGFSADVDAVGSCNVLFIDLCPDVKGTLKIDTIALYAAMSVGLDDVGNVVAQVTEFHLGVEGVKLDLSGLAGNILQPIINAVISLFEQQIQDALEGQLKDMLPGLVEDIFSAFQLDQNLDIPALVQGGAETTVTLETRYSVLDLTTTGITMQFDSRAQSSKKVLHNPLGSLGRGDCAGPDAPPFELNKNSEVSLAFFDDFLNQVLFAAWWGGALNVTLDSATLGDMGDTIAGYGITDPVIALDFFLAPMLSDCNPEQVMRFAIGDLYINAKFKMLGQPITMGVFATAMGEAEIALVDSENGPSFEMTVKSISVFEYEIASVTEGFEELIPIVEELLQGELVQGALQQIAGVSFGGITMPEIDLAALLPGVPAGSKLSIVPTELFRKSGYTEMTGNLE